MQMRNCQLGTARADLLWPDDRARTCDAVPGDGLRGRQLVVLHEIAADERAGAPQSRLAVHGNGP